MLRLQSISYMSVELTLKGSCKCNALDFIWEVSGSNIGWATEYRD